MSIWAKTIKRSNTTEIRKEDQILHIRKEGSENAFTEEQIGLFTQIIREAEKFFDQCPSESEKYKIAEKAESVPVILVPWKTFLVKRSGECLAFAKKMRDLYDKEMAQFEKKQLTPEERERRMAILQKKYGAWLSCFPTACSGCKQMLTTPLGYYVPDNDGGKIYICLDGIIDFYPSDQVDAIAAKVILHEFGHAIMHNIDHPNYETVFDYWVEESLANKIALKYLAVASMLLHKPDLLTVAEEMVENQPDAYKLGLYLFDYNASDWHTLQRNKPNINQEIGNLWVDAVCEGSRDFAKIQALFYRAFE